jgi:hypothetical protein
MPFLPPPPPTSAPSPPPPIPTYTRVYEGDVSGSAHNVELHIRGEHGERYSIVAFNGVSERDGDIYVRPVAQGTIRDDYTQELATYIPRHRYDEWYVYVTIPRHERAPEVYVTTDRGYRH